MRPSLLRILIGRPVANREAEGLKLGILEGVPAMRLDAFSSASYGPEATLAILASAGAAGVGRIVPITCAIIVLLVILFLSYWQTIAAHPSNGGSYIVAEDNLGTGAGLLASAAVMVDYTLNVSVGISAGVGALTSAVPALHAGTLWLCLGVLAALTLMNLRGTREAGLAWGVPTYLFVATLGLILVWGTWKGLTAGGHRHPVAPPSHARSRHPGALALAAASLRQRLHRHDRSGGGQQRRRLFSREAGPARPRHAGGHRWHAGAAAGRRSSRPWLRRHGDGTRPGRAIKPYCRSLSAPSMGAADSII